MSYFLYDADVRAWNFYYLDNDTGSAQYSTNYGTTYINLPYTFDTHIHQYTDDTTFCYQGIAYDIYFNSNTTPVRCDNLDISMIRPSPPQVFFPEDDIGYNSSTININYTQAIPSGTYSNITYYQIEIEYDNGTLAYDLGNNSYNLSYVWDVSSVPDAYYDVKVTAYDNASFSVSGFSGSFYVDKTDPVCSITDGNSYIGATETLSISMTDLAIDWFIWNDTGINESGNLSNILSVSKNIVIADNSSVNYTMLVYDTAGQSTECLVTITGQEKPFNPAALVRDCPSGFDDFMPLIVIAAITLILYVTAILTGTGVLGLVSSLMLFYVGLMLMFCHVFVAVLISVLALVSSLGFGYNIYKGLV